MRSLPREIAIDELPHGVTEAHVFCAGCLVVDGPSWRAEPGAAARLAAHPAFCGWPLVVLSDAPRRAVASDANFLWSTFTRFEPAADIHAARTEVVRNHLSYGSPLVIDARMKPPYPDELFCDPQTREKVSRRWTEYFPGGGVEMGDSDRGHLE